MPDLTDPDVREALKDHPSFDEAIKNIEENQGSDYDPFNREDDRVDNVEREEGLGREGKQKNKKSGGSKKVFEGETESGNTVGVSTDRLKIPGTSKFEDAVIIGESQDKPGQSSAEAFEQALRNETGNESFTQVADKIQSVQNRTGEAVIRPGDESQLKVTGEVESFSKPSRNNTGNNNNFLQPGDQVKVDGRTGPLTREGAEFIRERRNLDELPTFSLSEPSVAGEFTEDAILGQFETAGRTILGFNERTPEEAFQEASPEMAEFQERGTDWLDAAVNDFTTSQQREIATDRFRESFNEQLFFGTGLTDEVLPEEAKQFEEEQLGEAPGFITKEAVERTADFSSLAGIGAQTATNPQKTVEDVVGGAGILSAEVQGDTTGSTIKNTAAFGAEEVAPDIGLDILAGGLPVARAVPDNVQVPDKVQTAQRFVKGDLGFRATDQNVVTAPEDQVTGDVFGRSLEELDTSVKQRRFDTKRDEDGKVIERTQTVVKADSGEVTVGQQVEEPLSRTRFLKEKLGMEEVQFSDTAIGFGPGALVPKEQTREQQDGFNSVDDELFEPAGGPQGNVLGKIPLSNAVETFQNQFNLVSEFESPDTEFFQKPEQRQQGRQRSEQELGFQQESVQDPFVGFQQVTPRQLAVEEPVDQPRQRNRMRTDFDFGDDTNDDSWVGDSFSSGFDDSTEFAPSLAGITFGIQREDDEEDPLFTGLEVRGVNKENRDEDDIMSDAGFTL